MRGIPSDFLLLFFALLFLVESISYFGLRKLIKNFTLKFENLLCLFYLFISVSINAFGYYIFSHPEITIQNQDYSLFLAATTLTILNLIPKIFFSVMTIFSWGLKIFTSTQRLPLIILCGSLILAVGVFGTILTGIILGRKTIHVEDKHLYFIDLPKQLDGIRIVQLSDIHLGSLNKDPQLLIKAREIIDRVNPDLLVFTGDIVNNFGKEMSGFDSYLEKLTARYGKYAIEGNHDYGDYSTWPDSIGKAINKNLIRNKLVNNGFNLLLNNWVKVSIRDTSLYIIGVENWGHSPFPKYAQLEQATDSLPEKSFKILLSHDPAHWDAEVVTKTNIPLTLSGHTHGGQLGIKIAGIEFSPLYLYQKRWGGLYKSGQQYLYVNRGLGTIGFEGRIDMNPEITILNLHKTKDR